jgi:hypothetical protein
MCEEAPMVDLHTPDPDALGQRALADASRSSVSVAGVRP